MKNRLSEVLKVAAAGLVFAGAPMIGCQSQTERAKGEMLSQASKFREQLQGMPAQIDETTRRLVAATAGQNPKRADDFREFSKSLEALRKQALVVGSEANAAEVDAAKYFTAWAKEARGSQSADRAAVRATGAASKAQVDQALGYLQQARNDFTELMGAYDNVSKLMSKDLSESAILAAQPDVRAAMSKSLDVRNRIDRLDEAIDAALASK